MVEKALSFFKKPTSKHILINTVGNYINVFFTAFFALLLVRILNPSQYGVLSVLLGIAYVLANILDFGTTATIYSYLPTMIEQKSSNLYRFLKSTFFYQSLFSFVIIGLLFVFFPYLDRVFFKTYAPPWELYLTAFSVLFFIWQNFLLNIFFAGKKFVKANLYLNVSNVGKTAIILIFVALKAITVGTVIFIFGIIGPLIFFSLILLEKRSLLPIVLKSEIKKEEFRFRYTLTYFIASQFLNLGMRMDLFLLSYFRPNTPEIGFYGLSQKIILTVLTTVISITQVLSPGFSKLENKHYVRHQIKTGFFYLLIPTALFLSLLVLPNELFYLFFTKTYGQTATITKSLGIPFILFTLSNLPTLFILYAVKKPSYILVSSIVFFVTVTLGCWYLIPKWGVLGPPYALAFSFLISIFILTGASIYEYKRIN